MKVTVLRAAERAVSTLLEVRGGIVCCTLGTVGILVGCCGAATKIQPLSAVGAQQTAAACERLFPRGAFELTSVVEASIPLSDDASLIAVVTAPADQKRFRSVLLTQEGMVLFDAIRQGERLDVKRALPPIDPNGFGRHMTDDIRLLLMHPEGRAPEVGQTQQGERICRWSNGERQVEVLISAPREAQFVEIVGGSVTRNAWLKDIGDDGRARDVLLENTGLTGYRLRILLQTNDVK